MINDIYSVDNPSNAWLPNRESWLGAIVIETTHKFAGKFEEPRRYFKFVSGKPKGWDMPFFWLREADMPALTKVSHADAD